MELVIISNKKVQFDIAATAKIEDMVDILVKTVHFVIIGIRFKPFSCNLLTWFESILWYSFNLNINIMVIYIDRITTKPPHKLKDISK